MTAKDDDRELQYSGSGKNSGEIFQRLIHRKSMYYLEAYVKKVRCCRFEIEDESFMCALFVDGEPASFEVLSSPTNSEWITTKR